jgi:pilus assembly protein FimV
MSSMNPTLSNKALFAFHAACKPIHASKMLVLAGLFSLVASSAMALTMGRVVPRSASGEPFSAEVEINNISAAESSDLAARIAPAEAYASIGLARSATMDQIQARLDKTQNGQAVVRLSSPGVINAQRLELVIELTWAGGRAVREITVPLGPAAAPAMPATVNTPAATPQPSFFGGASAILSSLPPAPAATSAPAATTTATTIPPVTGATSTGNRAAGSNTPATGVTMTVVNKDGKELANKTETPPTATPAIPMPIIKAVTNTDLKNSEIAPNGVAIVIVARSKNFETYRHLMAQTASKPSSSERDVVANTSAGAVKKVATVNKEVEKAPADRLVLSKAAAANSKMDKTEALAQDRQKADAALRQAELSKNMQELNSLTKSAAGESNQPAVAAMSLASPSTLKPVGATVTDLPKPSSAPPAAKSESAYNLYYILPLVGLLLLAIFGMYYFYPNREKERDEWFLTVQR